MLELARRAQGRHTAPLLVHCRFRFPSLSSLTLNVISTGLTQHKPVSQSVLLCFTKTSTEIRLTPISHPHYHLHKPLHVSLRLLKPHHPSQCWPPPPPPHAVFLWHRAVLSSIPEQNNMFSQQGTHMPIKIHQCALFCVDHLQAEHFHAC